MEETNLPRPEIAESVIPEDVFPVELWFNILKLYLQDSIAKSADIYEAIRNIESFRKISLVCNLFRDIQKDTEKKDEEQYKAYIKAYLMDCFLETRKENGDLGIYPKNGQWDIHGCTGNLDYILARYLLNNDHSTIFQHFVSSLQEDPNKEKAVCLLLSLFGADINAQNPMVEKNRFMALEWAIKSNRHLVPLLLAKGAIVYDEILQLPEVLKDKELENLLKSYYKPNLNS